MPIQVGRYSVEPQTQGSVVSWRRGYEWHKSVDSFEVLDAYSVQRRDRATKYP